MVFLSQLPLSLMPTRYASMFYQRGYPSELSADTIRNLDNLARSLTKQIIQTILTLITPIHHQTQPTTTPPRNVSVSDVRTAIDLLSLPRHFRAHFTDLPSRMQAFGVSVDVGQHHHRAFKADFGERGTNDEVTDYILNGKTSTVSQERTHTIRPWPEKWSPGQGFDWTRRPVDISDENEAESGTDLEISSQATSNDSETMDEEIPDSDDSRESSSSTENDEENDESWNEGTAGDLKFLDSETLYLESLDSQWSQIEQRRLLVHIDHGRKVSKKFRQEAIKSFTQSEETVLKQTAWEKARKQLYSKFGNTWAVYDEDIVGIEGQGWEQPPEEWELFQKRRPSVGDSGIEDSGMKRREGIDGEVRYNGRKRKVHEIEDDESEFSG